MSLLEEFRKEGKGGRKHTVSKKESPLMYSYSWKHQRMSVITKASCFKLVSYVYLRLVWKPLTANLWWIIYSTFISPPATLSRPTFPSENTNKQRAAGKVRARGSRTYCSLTSGFHVSRILNKHYVYRLMPKTRQMTHIISLNPVL